MRKSHSIFIRPALRSGQSFQLSSEQLEHRLLLAYGLGSSLGDSPHAREIPISEFVESVNWDSSRGLFRGLSDADSITFTPTIVSGSASGIPDDSPSNAVDPNVGGTFGGVAQIKIEVPNFPRPIAGTNPQQYHPTEKITAEFSCTGSVVSESYVLTAAHCFDSFNEVTPLDGNNELNAGNGIFDPGTIVEVRLNDGDPAGNGIFSSTHIVSNVTMHPSFAGFASNNNDDVAILELLTPVPTGTPIYEIADSIMTSDQRINMVGYGLPGSGDTGLNASLFSPEVKRQRQNVADFFIADDETVLVELVIDGIPTGVFLPEPAGPDEVFIFDFDGPTDDGFVGAGTLGNDVEGNIAPGDSGGPSFLMDAAGNLLTDGSGRFIIGGINTFNGALGTGSDPGFFVDPNGAIGSSSGVSGGMMMGAYHDWIQSIIDVPPPPVGVDVGLSSSFVVEPGTGGNTKVTYELDLNNINSAPANGIIISQTNQDIPAGASVSVQAPAGSIFLQSTWFVPAMAGSSTETLTIEIEFDPATMNVGDPFDLAFSIVSLNEPDVDLSNNSISDSVTFEVPFAATVGGSSWVVDPAPLNLGANGTLSWANLNEFAITFAGPIASAPPALVLGPTDGAPAIPATLVTPFDNRTAVYSVPTLTEGFYKIVVEVTEIDFSIKPGDANGTGNVDIFDVAAFSRSYNPGVFLGNSPNPVDYNGSGTVDIFDVAVISRNYLTDLSGYTPPTVPPPPPSSPTSLADFAVVDAIWADEAEEESF